MVVKLQFTSLSPATGPNYALTCAGGTVVPNIVTRAQLLNGVNVTVPDQTQTVKVTSQGICSNQVNLTITGNG